MPPLLLSFDTATPHLAVVLSEGDEPLAWREDPSPELSHAERLNVFIAQVLDEAALALEQVDAMAVGTGPGSFTGLRIGLSAAKGLCFALDKPLIGMSTLEILLAQVHAADHVFPPDTVYLPMVDARRMEVYTRAFTAEATPLEDMAPQILDAPWCKAREAAGHTVVFGDGADKAAALWEAHPGITWLPNVRPSVRGLARCANQHHEQGRFADLAYLVPQYGKPANVAQQRRPTRSSKE